MQPLLLLLSATLALALASPPATAGADGRRYHVLRLSGDGRFLVAACDVRGHAPPTLAVVDPRGRVQERLATDRPGDLAWCGGLTRAQGALAGDRPLAARLAALGLGTAPVAAPCSPSRTRCVVVLQHTHGAELALVEGRATVRQEEVAAQPGPGLAAVRVAAAWHPDERWVAVAGARLARVEAGGLTWEPVFVAWERPGGPRDGQRPAVIDALVDWGRRQLKKCRFRKPECDGAELAFRRVLRDRPGDMHALEGIDAVTALRK